MRSNFRTKKQIILGSFVVLTVLGGIIVSERGKAQEPRADEIVDKLAAKTVEKFNSMSCTELTASMSPQAQAAQAQDPQKAKITAKFLAALKANPQLKARFFNQVSAPIVTKMFDCGLIPKQ
ncbi:MAG: hypothetical protein ACRDEA_17915 [Microcystaceae cyanobacterium]